MEPILHGIILAVGLILPLGVQNVFVFSQGATQPKLSLALPATITAAICDNLLIVLAVFGLSMIVLQFEWLRMTLICAGVLFLIYMGFVIWRSEAVMKGKSKILGFRQQIIFALSISLLNPHAIIDIVGVIGVSALNYAGSEQMIFMVTCIVVSWIWFFGLTLAGAFVKKLDGAGKIMTIFNKCSAIFIWGIAIYIAFGLL